MTINLCLVAKTRRNKSDKSVFDFNEHGINFKLSNGTN